MQIIVVEVSVIPFKHRSAIRVLGGASSGDTEVGNNPFLSDKAGGHPKNVAYIHTYIHTNNIIQANYIILM